jgi:toxin ParE1/3/4
VRVGWAASAEADLDRIVLYIAGDSPRAALAMQERLLEATEDLARFPRRGRIGRVSDTRELVVAGTSFIAVYQVESEIVWILHLVHGAQSWPPT